VAIAAGMIFGKDEELNNLEGLQSLRKGARSQQQAYRRRIMANQSPQMQSVREV